MTSHHSQNAGAQTTPPAVVVLLVDDQRFVGMAVGHLLDGEKDIELHCCVAATDAVETANRLRPAVILQDLMMPEIDGAKLVGMFRNNPTTAATPIVVLGGNDDAAARGRAMAAGANDYLVKLPDKDTLVRCIRRLHADHAIPTSAPASLVAVSGAGVEANETLDRAVLAELREIGGADGAGFVAGLIDQFIQEGGSLIERLRAAVRKMDVPALIAAAHSLKGASMTMGARRLAGLSGELEKRLGQPEATVDLMLVVAIDEEFGRVRNACLQERNGEQSLA